MGSYEPDQPEPQNLWIETPCIPSATLSRAAGCNIFLKLENLQPSGSFKSRGIGYMMQKAMFGKRTSDAHFYCSSGGNAGLACATAAAILNRPCTIVVPLSTKEHIIEKLRLLGAKVHQAGSHWALADAHLRSELLANDSVGVYVPPFDHPDIWEGASTLVDEIIAQVKSYNVSQIDGIICNCGGGGLLNGIMTGVEKNFSTSSSSHPKPKPRVLALETIGADSLNASVHAGHLVTLPAITSIATSLGAQRVSEESFRWSQEASYLTSLVVSDAEAVAATMRFADDARMLVEVACGATIATVYNGDLRRVLGGEEMSDEEWRGKNVVVIVCGGSNVSLDALGVWGEQFGVRDMDMYKKRI
ncbi:pyridoxal-phosphate dependent enzyme [Annulohypoxylon maeteangense]|uniref:pyridoxal-phosphate dependent enzyme n=1 Tax=Annulohypoxylon maeteangense TaxID=1927788 RepID=UPI0020077457|nr:pyridoxal-phosphate dependent enzyme [Annulohypoxylon maeteangense]KAI0883198.1 pyridoxal-phosphate dependent enzyme [Annulohypoxylon maeteangense]